ncbi:MAG: 7,8-didemethyl-8-hydroxy-5-deazariboflavin synthase CofG [Myxococcales bacterium]
MATSSSMPSSLSAVLTRALDGLLLEQDALALAELTHADLPALCEAAATRRNRAYGTQLTFSPKVFLPLTNLCRDVCDYCSFRRSPGDPGAWTMRPHEVREWLDRGRQAGACEALFCLGDRPESVFPSYRSELAEFGCVSTVDYLAWAAEQALALDLLPHTNAGLLTRDELSRLRPLNVSFGLMLENISPRLCEKGMPHHRARDKRPELRVRMTREAGELKIPFTSGILLGIGETRLERVQSLLAIRALHAEHGHIQEVIVQNFRTKPETPMASAPEPEDLEIAHAVALARLILPDEVSVQAPPNLNPHATELLIQAGINDFGGISPVTPDYINPGHPWPHLARLAEQCGALGFSLAPRLPIYPRFAADEAFVDARLRDTLERERQRLARVTRADRLAPEQGERLLPILASDAGPGLTNSEVEPAGRASP